MRINRLLIACLCLGLAACTVGQTTAPTITTQNPGDPNFSKLQLAVGTANLYGSGSVGLNVVSTMRQPDGASATGVNTPTLSGPFAFTAAAAASAGGGLADPYTTLFDGGPSLPETLAASLAIEGTLQSVHPGTPNCDGVGVSPPFTTCPAGIPANTTTFGQSGGLFAMGIAPYNAVPFTGQAYSYAPYPQPMYSTSHPVFLPWGGPPAFDPDGNGMGTRDGLVPLGSDSFNFPYFLGVGEGITVFDGVTVATGTYAVNAQIGYLSGSGQPVIVNISQTARLSSLAVLPSVTAPLVTPTANGSATFSVILPAGVTQAYVQIVDYGPAAGPLSAGGGGPLTAANCQMARGTSFAPVYYTVLVTSSGSFKLGPLHGPNSVNNGSLTPSPSICTAAQNNAAGQTNAGDNFTVQMMGFDYPIYQAALSLTQATTPQAPSIFGPGGQSDITISVPVEEDPPYTSATPLSSSRRPLINRFARRFAPGLRGSPEIYRRLGVPPPR
jgi:hypothetical protein